MQVDVYDLQTCGLDKCLSVLTIVENLCRLPLNIEDSR
jgi:hypothetical protein